MATHSGNRSLENLLIHPLMAKTALSGFMLLLALASPARAQQVRAIQAPAPYNACNLRSGGGTQYSVVGTFRNGTSVTLLGESGRGWYRVQIQQEIGWLARQCLGL